MLSWIVPILALGAYTVAWIEFLPKRADVFPMVSIGLSLIAIGIGMLPNWFGFVIIVLGVADLAWTARKYGIESEVRDALGDIAGALKIAGSAIRAVALFLWGLLARTTRWTIDKMRSRRREALASGRKRRWPSAVGLVAISPVAALPATLVLTLIFAVASLVSGNSPSQIMDPGQLLLGWIGASALIILLGLDIMVRGFLIGIPVLGAAGVMGAVFAIKPGSYWPRFGVAAMAIGALYPLAFVLGLAAGWDMPNLYN